MIDLANAAQLVYFWFLVFNLIFIVALFIWHFKEIARPFKSINRRFLVLILLLTLFGIYLRVTMSGRYGLDDLLWEHVRNAKSALNNFKFTSFTHPGGHSLLVALSFILAHNMDIENVSMLTIFLDSLSILLIFCISFLLFKKTEIALFSSLIFAILPWQIFISGMGLNIISSLFFFLLSVVILLVSKELRSKNLFYFSLILLLWSAEIRVENVMFIPLFLFTYFRTKYKVSKSFKYFLPLLIIFSLPVTVWISYSPVLFGPSSSIEGDGDFISFQNFLNNCVNYIIPHFFVNKYGNYYPTFVFLFSLLGLVLIVKHKESFYLLLLWSGIWSIVYGSFWYGSQIYRYSVLIHPLLATLSACGFYVLFDYASSSLAKKWKMIKTLWILFLLFIVFSTFSVKGLINPSSITSWPSIREFRTLENEIEDDACILMQKIKYGRYENAVYLINKKRKFIEWPTKHDIFSFNCTKIYYLNLRNYAHPRYEDLKIYDKNQELLFQTYDPKKILEIKWLDVYEIAPKNDSNLK